MAQKRPYQPSLLRTIHTMTAIVVAGAWCSGLAIYSRYDGRWGSLPWSVPGDLFSLHKSVSLILLPVALALLLYAITIGNWRLRNPANSVMMLTLALPILSGQGMHRRWLIEKQFDHWIYHLHLLGWMLLFFGLIWHGISAWQRGGSGMLASMVDVQLRKNDRPLDWPGQITAWLRHPH